MNVQRHLTDEEVQKAFLAGPLKLAEHSDEWGAHQHILHEKCARCAARLIELVVLQNTTQELTRN